MLRPWILALGLVAFALASDVSQVLAQQSSSARPWLGVGFLQTNRGVLIDEVIPDSPADIAGILVDDVVYAIDGYATPSTRSLVEAIQKHEVGDEVVVSLHRKGRAITLKAELTHFLEPPELLRRRLVDKPAPGFSLPVLHGKASGSLEELQGTVVVLEFWSGWCPICTTSFETLANLQADYIGELVVLTVTADHESQIKRFLATNSMPLPVLHDPRRQTHQAYHYEQIVPTVVVIGRDGLVRYADTGNDLNMDSVVLSAKRAVRELPH